MIQSFLRKLTIAALVLSATLPAALHAQGNVSPNPMRWHRVSLDLAGPSTTVNATPNPFMDYRLEVTFTGPSSQQYRVPGFFAGDGHGGWTGDVWRVNFNPDEAGEWRYEVSFREGSKVAIDLTGSEGAALAPYDGVSGAFTVAESNKAQPDFRAPENGMLTNRGHHYLTFAGSGRPFIYTGPGIPENFLGYRGFTNTNTGIGHEYSVHESDWKPGDPDWGDGDGRALIGALNYIAEQGGNALYLMSNTIGGDGKDIFLHPAPEGDRERYDLLKIQQWDTALTHAQSLGLFFVWHLAEHETPNHTYYGPATGSDIGDSRRLYFRMLVAFFGHHNGLKWNLMEEVEYDAAQRAAQAAYLKAVDPYDHPVTYQAGGVGLGRETYNEHYDDKNFDAASLQGFFSNQRMFNEMQRQRKNSADAGNPWTIGLDEPQTIHNDLEDRNKGYPAARREKMWPALMGGGDGFLWYIQHDGGGHGFDQRIEDFSIMGPAFNWCGHLRDFLSPLPLLEMQSSMSLAKASTGLAYTLYLPGQVYAIYSSDAGAGVTLDLRGETGAFDVQWFNPRDGGDLQKGSIATVMGGAEVSLGEAPADANLDWAILVTASNDQPESNDRPQ